MTAREEHHGNLAQNVRGYKEKAWSIFKHMVEVRQAELMKEGERKSWEIKENRGMMEEGWESLAASGKEERERE